MLLGDMTWVDFAAEAPQAYAIVPVGGVEPHGPHLPLSADTIISDFFARKLADTIGGWVLPSIGYGVATPSFRLGGDFPGVISLSGPTFTSLVSETLTSLAGYRVRRFIIVNSAIDNVSFLCESARILLDRVPDARVMVINWWDVVGERFRDALADETGVPRDQDHHAAMVESSLVMAIAPHTAHPERVDQETGLADPAPVRRIRYHMYPTAPDTITPSGVVYRADKASVEIGERVAERVLENLVAAVHREFA